MFWTKRRNTVKRRKDETEKGKTNTGKRTNIFTGSENYFGSAKKYKLTC